MRTIARTSTRRSAAIKATRRGCVSHRGPYCDAATCDPANA